MIAIINRKRYDTRTAERLASFDNGGALSDLRHCEEALCRTPGGAFFLHGSGGACTRYAERVSDGWTSGEKIIPLSEDAALDWLEEKGEAAVIEAQFSHRIEEA